MFSEELGESLLLATYLLDGTFKLDPKAKPKTLDVITDNFTIQCLYQPEGDRITFLAAPNGYQGRRPTDLNSNKRRPNQVCANICARAGPKKAVSMTLPPKKPK